MSAVAELDTSGIVREMTPDEEPVAGGGGLPQRAKVYVAIVATASLAAAGPSYLHISGSTKMWAIFAVLAIAATVAQPFPVMAPPKQMYHTSIVFLVAAAIILPPQLLVLIPLVQTIPEWLKQR